MQHRCWYLLAATICVLVVALSDPRQLCASVPESGARVAGIVVDAAGAPVPGATIEILAAGATARRLETGEDGRFEATDLPPGEVSVSANAPGFAMATTSALAGLGGDFVRLILQPALVETVTVTASRGAERLSTPAGTSVLTAAELLLSAAGTVDDALRNTPGFSLFRRSSSRVSNPTTQGVTLRGLSGSGASRTLVLADGLPLNDAFGSWVYWNRVPQTAIERVEVVRGASGDLYGADALGGVIQMLTFAPGPARFRATADFASHDTSRISAFAGGQSRQWSGAFSGEWVKTDGVITTAPESRGEIDVPADSDYATGFGAVGYDNGTVQALVRANLYHEQRGNGTPAQGNDTRWRQLSGEAGGPVAGGLWLVRAAGGEQTYRQTFSVVAVDRLSERLTTSQRIPSTFTTAAAQWTRAGESWALLLGGDWKRTKATVEETRYSFAGGMPSGPFLAGGTETNGSGFARVSVAASPRLTLVAGVREDFWRSESREAALATHSVSFFSPRVSASYRVTDDLTLHAAVSRAHRTPTLNELYRGFRVGNVVTSPNANLDPERLTGLEAGVLLTRQRFSARATGFWSQLDDAITNVTLDVTPTLITRERQNTDTVRAGGVEFEADFRPTALWTVNTLAAFTSSRFHATPAHPALEGNRVPQVPAYQVGGGVTYLNPRGFTGAAQLRIVGSQFDDDLNQLELRAFAVVDASVSQELRRGLEAFLAVENLSDAEYDVGRTPIRTVGWPRTIRGGIRLSLP
jgi:outer membrane receptor protein involved in Fe transport